MGDLQPADWYYPTAASNPVPCRWEGWVDCGAAGLQWMTISLFSAE